jgi:hypothetical protein
VNNETHPYHSKKSSNNSTFAPEKVNMKAAKLAQSYREIPGFRQHPINPHSRERE